jgi:chromosome segregation ATPase
MSAFTPIGQYQPDNDNDGSFWPSFTDIMMVVVLIFLLASSLLIVRNWQLVRELQESIAAERVAAEMIESTSQENATLEERLINAEQLTSILRLRIQDRDERLREAANEDLKKQQTIATLQREKSQLNQRIQTSQSELADTRQTMNVVSAEAQLLVEQLELLKQQLEQQIQLAQANEQELELAIAEIAVLNASSEQQQQSIDLLEQEKIEYNRQLLSLQGDYEVVKSKYNQLIKPARSARGKYVVEVHYVKEKKGEVIRFKKPGDPAYQNLPLEEVEKQLSALKKEKGKDLYVKIIIPKNSGLTYNEAWNFMRSLLDKYDYYYQDSTDDRQNTPAG